jgi:hypothetical protein
MIGIGGDPEDKGEQDGSSKPSVERRIGSGDQPEENTGDEENKADGPDSPRPPGTLPVSRFTRAGTSHL